MAWLRTTSDRVIITRAGFSFRFTANTPRDIPDVAVNACLEAGCLHAKVSEFSPLTEEQKGVRVDNTELDKALHTVVELGNPEDFKVDKTPKSYVVNSLLKNKRSAKDIAARFVEKLNGGSF